MATINWWESNCNVRVVVCTLLDIKTIPKNVFYSFFIYILSGNLACDIALKAVKTVTREDNDRKEIDIKNYAKIEKV